MEKLTVFYLESCPYCQKAKRALGELTAENAAYESVPLDWIEESVQPEVAGLYDYYSVPSVFAGKEKLFETKISDSYEVIKENMKAALDKAIASQG